MFYIKICTETELFSKFYFEKVTIDETKWSSVCVCPSVASHISETSQVITIKFDMVTASVMRIHQVLIKLAYFMEPAPNSAKSAEDSMKSANLSITQNRQELFRVCVCVCVCRRDLVTSVRSYTTGRKAVLPPT